MTKRKVLVEFTVDPTEYQKGFHPHDPIKVYTPSPAPHLEDTQDNAIMLVKEMIKGDIDICPTEVVGNMVPLFKTAINPQLVADSLTALVEACTAFAGSAQGYIYGPMSITLKAPKVSPLGVVLRSDEKPYEVTFFRPLQVRPPSPDNDGNPTTIPER